MLCKERLSSPHASGNGGIIDFSKFGPWPRGARLYDIGLSKEPALDVEPALPRCLPYSTDYTAVDPATREPLSGTKLEEESVPFAFRYLSSNGKPILDFLLSKSNFGAPRTSRAPERPQCGFGR